MVLERTVRSFPYATTPLGWLRMTIPRTTAQDVLDLFNVTEAASGKLERWRRDRTKAVVVPHVMGHVTTVAYRLRTQDVEQVCLTTAHALGKVKRAEAESFKAIVDWHPDFAFTHTLHYALEALGKLPTWQEFINFLRTDEQGRIMLWDPVVETAWRVCRATGQPFKKVWESVQWRVGNAYYSFLREIYVVVNLRSFGLDIRLHPLADALFSVDFWCARTICSLWVKNAKFHKGQEGRKILPETLFGESKPPFRFHNIQLDKASKYGVVHLPNSDHINRAARELSGALGGFC